jgi:microcystin-dependent protein
MRDLIDAPNLDAFARSEGSTFTVCSAGDAELVLDTVDTTSNTLDDWEQFSLVFRGPADECVDSGIHRIDHPQLDAFDMNLRPVQSMHPDAEVMHYEATFTRHLPGRKSGSPHAEPLEAESSRRGFFSKLAAALGSVGLFSGLSAIDDARAASKPVPGKASRDSFRGSIAMVAFNFPPNGWAFCNGALIPIAQNNALFALIGTIYGGDGRSTFGLPDLRGRIPVNAGDGPGRTRRYLGRTGGAEQVTLTTQQIPAHDHQVDTRVTTDLQLPVSSGEADATTPEGNVLGAQPSSRGTVPIYSTGSANTSIPVEGQTSVDGTIASSGGNQAHNNMPPFQVVNFIINLDGVFPSR